MSILISNLNTIASCKDDIRDAIITKGVDMTGVELSGYAAAITSISGGGGSKPEETLVETITSNGSYHYNPTVGSVFSGVDITVSVDSKNLHPANNEIYYRTYTGGVLSSLTNTSDFGATLLSNTNNGDYCVLTFDGPVLRTGYQSFLDKVQLMEIYLPDTVTVISESSFLNSGLQYISMPGVTEIELYGLSDCFALSNSVTDKLNDIEIETLGNAAFANDTGFFTVRIPSTVTTIGQGCFRECYRLKYIYLYSTTPPTLTKENPGDAYEQFIDNALDRKIVVPAGSVNAYQTAPGWSVYASDIISQ